MADRGDMVRSPLAGIAVISTVAATGGRTNVVVAEQPAGLVLEVIARQGKVGITRRALAEALAIEPPPTPRIEIAGGRAILWSGPGRWLLMADAASSGDVAAAGRALAGLAAVIDQSDARVVLRLAGPKVRDTLAKLVGVDVDARIFAEGAAAMTVIAHMPVHLWRLADQDGAAVFAIAGPASTAASLWHHVVEAAAEYGLEARPAAALSR